MLAGKLPRPFGPYTLVERLAQGGMAEVFLARQSISTGVERKLVIKSVLPHLSEDQQFISMFLEEARLAVGLSHPNIVHMYDFGLEGDTYYIALEYIEGASLQDILKATGKPVPKAVAVRIACGVAAGLAYAHALCDEHGRRLGLVHRDVSPPNVLITRDGSVKLVDFGIAKAIHRDPGTHSTTLKGKFAYMAPEQFDAVVTHRVDLYALGAVLYEMLAGQPLFGQKTVAELIRAVCAAEVDPLRTRAPWVPPALEAVVMKAISRDPEKRFDSAESMLLALERFLTQFGLVASPMLVGEYVRNVLSGAEAPTDEDGNDAASDRDSDPYDVTAVRRQVDVEGPDDSLTGEELWLRPNRAKFAAPQTSEIEALDTKPQAFVLLSSRPVTDPSSEDRASEKTPNDLPSGMLRRPLAPMKPTAAPRLKTPAPVNSPAAIRRSPMPTTDVAGMFEEITASHPVPEPKTIPGASPLQAAALRVAGTDAAAVDGQEAGPRLSPKPIRRQALDFDEDDRTIAEPARSLEAERSRAPVETEPDTRPQQIPATIGLPGADPTDPAVPNFPLAPQPSARPPQPSRRPPEPVDAAKKVFAAAKASAIAPAAAKSARGSEAGEPAVTTPMPRVAAPAAPPLFAPGPAPAPAVATAQARTPAAAKSVAPKNAAPPAPAEMMTFAATLGPLRGMTPIPPPPLDVADTGRTSVASPPRMSDAAPHKDAALDDELTPRARVPGDGQGSVAMLTPPIAAAATATEVSAPAHRGASSTDDRDSSTEVAGPVAPAELRKIKGPLSDEPTVVLADPLDDPQPNAERASVPASISLALPIGPPASLGLDAERPLRPSRVMSGSSRGLRLAFVAGGLTLVVGAALAAVNLLGNGEGALVTDAASGPRGHGPTGEPRTSVSIIHPTLDPVVPSAPMPSKAIGRELTKTAQGAPAPLPDAGHGATTVTAAAETTHAAGPKQGPSGPQRVQKRPPVADEWSRTEPSTAGRTARVFVNTEPWSRVRIGPRDLGATPIAGVEMPVGPVTLTLIDPEGQRYRRMIRVQENGANRFFFDLR